MKKPFYLVGLAALALVGCSDNDFFSGGPDDNFGQASKGQLAFGISDGSGKTTRGEITGESAAKKLGGHFTVYGWKQVNSKSDASAIGFQDVFADYVVTWKGASSAGSSESNTRGWEYVGDTTTPVTLVNGTALSPSEQYIHYWDWSTDRYDFTAWSIAKGNAQVVSRYQVNGNGVAASNSEASTAPEVKFFASTPKDLGGVYVSDKFTSTPDGKKPRFLDKSYAVVEGAAAGSTDVNAVGIDSVFLTNHPGSGYHIGKYSQVDDYTNTSDADKGVVNLQFRNLAAKVRIGIYETIPGYKVSNVVFYNEDATANKYLYTWSEPANNDDFPGDQTYATLFAESDIFGRGGNVTVKYHDTYYNSEGIQKDNVAYTSTNLTNSRSYFAFGKLTNEKGSTTEIGNNPIGVTSNTASMSIGNDDENLYTYVFPMENNDKTLELKVNYLLTSLDGSGENIRVTGANATVPVKFAQWRPNYAYTYLFKVSDNTNGHTGGSVMTPEGLYPITFDACVVNTEDGMQETITTINDKSITTYQDGSQVLADNEYKNGKKIFVTVEDLPTLSSTNFKLYIAEDFDAVEGITEETAANYLHNGIVFTDVTSTVYFSETAIPNSSGNKNPIAVTAGQVATFTPNDNTVYVVKYTYGSGSESYKVIKVGDATATQSYTVNVSASASVATDVALPFTIENGTFAGVTGAKGAIAIVDGSDKDVTSQFVISETSSGNYTATPKTAVAATGYKVKVGNNTSTNGFEVTAPVWFKSTTQITDDNYVEQVSITAGDKAKNSVDVILKNKATDGSVITKVQPTVTKDAADTKDVTIEETSTAGTYKITASDKAAGTYVITQNGGSMKVNVDKYSMELDGTIINVGDADHNTAKLTLSNEGSTVCTGKTITVPANVTATATATEDSKAKSTITAAEAGTATLTFENAKINIEVVDYVLQQAKTRDGVLTVQLKQKKAGESTYSAVNGATTLTATGCTITPTSTPGVYKVNSGAADKVVKFSYKDEVVADVTLGADPGSDPAL